MLLTSQRLQPLPHGLQALAAAATMGQQVLVWLLAVLTPSLFSRVRPLLYAFSVSFPAVRAQGMGPFGHRAGSQHPTALRKWEPGLAWWAALAWPLPQAHPLGRPPGQPPHLEASSSAHHAPPVEPAARRAPPAKFFACFARAGSWAAAAPTPPAVPSSFGPALLACRSSPPHSSAPPCL